MSASKDLNTTNIAPFNQKIPKKIYHPLKGVSIFFFKKIFFVLRSICK